MLRFGLLGASDIAKGAIVEPAREIDGVEPVAVAARDRNRAQAFAEENGVPAVAGSYAELVERDDVNAIYISTPATSHFEWSERALRAGKHVLCEKPTTMNAGDAERLVALAADRGLLLAEGLHYRYHPMMSRAIEILASGELGTSEYVEAVLFIDCKDSPVYWDASLGGGTTRHHGCYAIHCIRSVMGEEPEVGDVEVAWQGGVDRTLDAELTFPGGARGRMRSSLVSPEYENWLSLKGSLGEMLVDNFVIPHLDGVRPGVRFGSIRVRSEDGEREETFGPPVTYLCQLQAFVDSLQTGAPLPTGSASIVGNAQAIDAMLAAAGPPG